MIRKYQLVFVSSQLLLLFFITSSHIAQLCLYGLLLFFSSHSQVVAPKKAKLYEAEVTLAATMELLNNKRAELAEIEEKVNVLKQQFQEMTDKKAQLEFQVERFE